MVFNVQGQCTLIPKWTTRTKYRAREQVELKKEQEEVTAKSELAFGNCITRKEEEKV